MTPELTKDEAKVLELYRRARDAKFSDMELSFEDGLLKKLFVTYKEDPTMLRGLTRLRETT